MVNGIYHLDTVGAFSLWVAWIIFPVGCVMYTSTCCCWWILVTRFIIDILLFLFSLNWNAAICFLWWTEHTCLLQPTLSPVQTHCLWGHCSHSLCSSNTVSGHNQLSSIIWVLKEEPAAFDRALHCCRAISYPPAGEKSLSGESRGSSPDN